MALLESVIQRGSRAAQPAFGDVATGTIYYVTDENVTERSSGAAWEDISDAGSFALANDSVTDAILRESAAVSVIGRSANSTGNPADIVAGANDRLLARTADSVAFQQLTVGMVPDTTLTPAKLTVAAKTHVIAFTFDGGGSAIAVNSLSPIIRIPIGGTITEWSVLADQVGNIEFDIYADAPGTTNPPTTSIVAAAPPDLTGGASDFDSSSTLTGWTTTVTAGHGFRAEVVSTSGTIEQVTVQLTFTGS